LNPNDNNLPNLAQDLVRIHKVITRGLTIGLTRGKEFLADGFTSEGIKDGFAKYIQSLGAVLDAHHLAEDEIAFPALKRKIPGAPYKRLALDHKKIEAALTPMMKSIAEVAEANPLPGIGGVVDGLKKIKAVWTSHIGIEETCFSSNEIVGAMSPEEQAEISIAMAKHSQEHAGPPYLVVPFVLYNLAGPDRDAMSATFPAPVRELVEKDWKDQWGLMRPFLLD
jgi:hypothetical protein